MLNNTGLSQPNIDQIKAILAPFSHMITRVDLFGSRAKGTYRPNSDIDLVIHGAIDEKTIDRLTSIFLESPLPYKVDIKSYEHTQYAPLKAHMDEVATTLFTQASLHQ